MDTTLKADTETKKDGVIHCGKQEDCMTFKNNTCVFTRCCKCEHLSYCVSGDMCKLQKKLKGWAENKYILKIQ